MKIMNVLDFFDDIERGIFEDAEKNLRLREEHIPRVSRKVSSNPFQQQLDFSSSTLGSKAAMKTKQCCPIRGCGLEQPIDNFYYPKFDNSKGFTGPVKNILQSLLPDTDERRHLCIHCWDIQSQHENWITHRHIELVNGWDTTDDHDELLEAREKVKFWIAEYNKQRENRPRLEVEKARYLW